jgi:hypothetical protein
VTAKFAQEHDGWQCISTESEPQEEAPFTDSELISSIIEGLAWFRPLLFAVYLIEN